MGRPASYVKVKPLKLTTMKIKIIPTQKQIITFLHILFWIVSFNYWSFILNPGVESTSVFQGFEVEWDFVYLVNFMTLLFCSLPFIWLFRKIRLWIKITVSLIFVAQLLYLIFVSLNPEQSDTNEIFMDYFIRNFLYVVVFHATIAFAVYYHLKVLIIRFLNRSRFGIYLISVAGLCLFSAVMNFSIFNFFLDKLFPSLFYISYFKIWELILIIAGYLVFTGGLFLTGQYAQMLIEKRDAARSELSALKAQINPHFLFNNLNTIYSMASQNDRRTTDVILKLSDFLRYVLYDTSSERIPLEKEVEMIKTYVGLQKERINAEITTIQLEISGNFSGVEIAPLLLLPLAENCFKHGVGRDSGYIHITIGYNNQQLVFKTENNIALRERAETNENGGIGIQNVEKRLKLIYPNLYSLEYGESEGIFRLEMKIDLKK